MKFIWYEVWMKDILLKLLNKQLPLVNVYRLKTTPVLHLCFWSVAALQHTDPWDTNVTDWLTKEMCHFKLPQQTADSAPTCLLR